MLSLKIFKQRKRAIIIYPEGTRGLPQQQLPLKGGVGVIYQKLQLPIVPVAVNTGLFFPKKGKINSGIATIKFLPPIQAGLPKKEMMAQLEDYLTSRHRLNYYRNDADKLHQARSLIIWVA